MAKAAVKGKSWASSAEAASKPRDDRLMQLVIMRIKQRKADEESRKAKKQEPVAAAS